MKYFFILLLLIPFLACSTNGTVSNTDFIEIKISNQIWSTNLGIETPNSICPENCETVGRLYTYEDALQLENMYEGWRLPNEEDWNVLETYVKDDKVRSSNSYKSGADKLKKIKGFDQFPGYVYKSSNIDQAGIWGIYWVKGVYYSDETPIAFNRILKTEGRNHT